VRASNEAEVGPSARTQEGALLERWLVQCGVRAPLYSIAQNGADRAEFVQFSEVEFRIRQ
jgi:hypothetical protein